MNRILLSVLTTIVSLSVFSDPIQADPAARELTKDEVMSLPKEQRQVYMQKLIAMKTGGKVAKPGTGKGCVRVVSSLNDIPPALLDDDFKMLRNVIKIDIGFVKGKKVTPSSAKAALANYKANACVYIIDSPEYPRLLVAPEEGWAMVNVKEMSEGNPSETVKLARLRKEVMRAIGYVSGAGLNGGVMQSVTDNQSLDRLLTEQFPAVGRAALLAHLASLGVEPVYETSYLRACEQGWAPSPTNDTQKAIYERVRSAKERGPAKAIQIKP